MSRLQIGVTLVVSAAVFVVPFVTGIVYDMALNNYIVLVTSGEGQGIAAAPRCVALANSSSGKTKRDCF
jgi:hypothetical protein